MHANCEDVRRKAWHHVSASRRRLLPRQQVLLVSCKHEETAATARRDQSSLRDLVAQETSRWHRRPRLKRVEMEKSLTGLELICLHVV
ncbi:unnamed protein product [Protopolystoma xenopodis]|uniref:Uncharacterized protein n=1 Tax=Protopolystoma xenopodis TaxID=117903 RepID=A0A448WD21_9PLAT|nr:unnamed protein product [Protopolystoma xenopodis]